MALKIYDNKESVPRECGGVIDFNDAFFNSYVLSDTELTRFIMQEIDKATYVSSTMFDGRDPGLGHLSKNLLSTGCKTLLNILYNPDKCFSVVECGVNALKLLSKINRGNIVWDTPILHVDPGIKCDILYHDKHYEDYQLLFKGVMNDD